MSDERLTSSEPKAPGSKLVGLSSPLKTSSSQVTVLSSKLQAPSSELLARSEEVIRFEQAMVDFFVDAAELLGVPKSVAAIYGIVFASPVPLSFADIESRLDISKGSVSQGLRLLREVGALKATSNEQGAGSKVQGGKVGRVVPNAPGGSAGSEAGKVGRVVPNAPGASASLRADESEVGAGSSRGVLFEPDTEMRKLIQRFIENRLDRQLQAGKGKLKALAQAAGAYGNGEQKVLRQRIAKLQQWHDRTRALLPVAKTFLKLGGGS